MDRQEAEQIIAHHGDAVYRLAYARTLSREDAEDVTQETFLRLVHTGCTFRDEDHCRAWLLRVAGNCARDLFRRAERRRSCPLEEADAVAAEENGDGEDVLAAVQSLPETYRAVVHLFYYEELSVAEIAALLHRRQGTVRTQLCRAREMLRRKLKEDEAYV